MDQRQLERGGLEGESGHALTFPTSAAPHLAHGIVWLRRDLRLDDHLPLLAAAQRCAQVTCAFVLDPPLLRGPRVGAPIVQFFFDALRELRDELRAMGSELALLEGDPAVELGALARRMGARALFFGADSDPAMRARDARVTAQLAAAGLAVVPLDDHVLAPAGAVVKVGGGPFTVFTPYRRRWDGWRAEHVSPPIASRAALHGRLAPARAIGPIRPVPPPEAYGHAGSERFPVSGAREAERLLAVFAERIGDYAVGRNAPALEATSRLSPHLRAGTIGIRTCVAAAAVRAQADPAAARGATAWLGELCWRDFYHQLLVGAPRVADEPFLPAARRIAYRDDPAAFAAWCAGATGYPIVDAAMRQLNTTGWMHNRLRMIAASFLTKHLVIDYRLGERYFEQHLADADLAANNGGWQWSASTGTDAAPYFRVFNPVLQGRTYDPDGAFVRAWLPELAGVPDAYVHAPWEIDPERAPIVEHAAARARALAVYGAALRARGAKHSR